MPRRRRRTPSSGGTTSPPGLPSPPASARGTTRCTSRGCTPSPSLAAHDALNAIDRRYASYASRPLRRHRGGPRTRPWPPPRAPPSSRPSPTYPRSSPDAVPAPWRSSRRRTPTSSPAVADGPAEDRGVAVGTAAAQAVLATRVGRRLRHADHRRCERLPAGHRARRVAVHPRPAVRLRPRMGCGAHRSPCAGTRPGTSTGPTRCAAGPTRATSRRSSGWAVTASPRRRPARPTRRRPPGSGSRAARCSGTGSRARSPSTGTSTPGTPHGCSRCSTWRSPTVTSPRSR